MKRAAQLLACALALASLAPLAPACNREAEHEHDHDREHPRGHEGEEHAQPEGKLRIDRGMLRDLRVTVAPAESRPAGDAVSALGELRVNEDAYAEVGPALAARVTRVLAAPGDAVTAGQSLCELESADVGRSRAALIGAESRADLARKTLERKRPLAVDQIVPQRELQAAESELAQAEAERRAASEALGALGAARGAGGKFVLSAPLAGTVIDRQALRGRQAEAGQTLFTVADLSRMWLVVHAFERDALRVRAGSSARVTFPALPGQSWSGKVSRIGSQVDETSRTVDVRVEVDNPSGVLRPGMSASALLPIGGSNETVVAVPVEALQRLPHGWCVFIPQQEQGVFEVRPIGRGRDLGGETEVLSGLRAGESVVVEGAFLLKAEADKARGSGEEHHH